jgi:hypothetical protein
MKCTNKDTKESVLIRTYGKKSEILIDRCQELIVFQLTRRNLEHDQPLTVWFRTIVAR